MAKGDVTLKFDAQTAAFLDAVLKARDATVAAANATRDLGEHAGKAADKSMAAFEKVAGSLGMVTSVAGAAAAGVELVMKTVDEHYKRMQEMAEWSRQQTQTLGQAMANVGMEGQFGQMAQIVAGKAGGQFSDMQLRKAAAAIITGEKGQITPDEVGKALDTFKLAVAGGRSPENATAVAEMAARLGPAGLEDMAAEAADRGVSPEELRVVNRATDKRSALTMLLAAHRPDVEEGSRALLAIEGEASRRHMTMEEVAARPEMFPDEKMREAVRSLGRGLAADRATPQESLAAAAGSVRQNSELLAQLENQRTGAMTERLDEGPEAFIQRLRSDLTARTRVDLGLKPDTYIPDFISGASNMEVQRQREPALFWQYEERRYGGHENMSGAWQRAEQEDMKRMTAEQVRILQGIHNEIRGGATLDNGSEGQR